LDADLYFFSDPSVLIDEMEDNSVLITEHRYTPKYDLSLESGIYCVQFMTFKNTIKGMNVLNWWRNVCIDWCYAKFEDGKFGDQKYLDDWPSRFEGIHVLKHLGGGLAPWNVQQYDLNNLNFNLIFYHFHGLKFLENSKIDLCRYQISNDVLNLIYKPYICHINKIEVNLLRIISEFNPLQTCTKTIWSWKSPLQNLRLLLKGHYNIFKKEKIICHKL
jgi:hypothetical protein